MQDNSFAPPDSQAVIDVLPVPGLMTGLAIAAIVLGLIGVLFGGLGVVGALLMDTVGDLAASQLDAGVRPAFQDLLQAQAAYMPITLLSARFTLLASLAMVVGGAVALAKRAYGLLAWAALGGALADVVSILVQILTNMALSSEMQAYNEALARSTGTDVGGASSSVIGIFGLVLVGAFAVFWGYAFVRIREYVADPLGG